MPITRPTPGPATCSAPPPEAGPGSDATAVAWSWTCARSLVLFPVMLVIALGAAVALTPSLRRADAAVAPARLLPTRPADHPRDAVVMTATQCTRCHQVEEPFSHPTGVRPDFAVPADFPLVNGQMACTTCHLDTVEAHAAARASGGMLLRGTGEGSAFCFQCHSSVALTWKAQHPLSTQFAHLAWAGSSRLPRRASSAQDDGSRLCLSCHDGSVGRDALGGAHAGSGGSRLNGHPSGIAYSSGAHPGVGQSDSSLTPVSTLDRRLRLFNGQVGCATCHSPYSHEDYLLVMSNESSRLCLSCHQMN